MDLKSYLSDKLSSLKQKDIDLAQAAINLGSKGIQSKIRKKILTHKSKPTVKQESRTRDNSVKKQFRTKFKSLEGSMKTKDSSDSKRQHSVRSIINEEERIKFLKKMKQEKKRFQELRLCNVENVKNKLMKQLEQEENHKKEKQLKESERVQKNILNMQQKLEQRKHERQQLKEVTQGAWRKVKNSKPLFQKLEEKFYSRHVIPELERKKQELAKKREYLAPMDMKKIAEHESTYFQVLSEQDTRRQTKMKMSRLEQKTHEAGLKFYRPRVADIIEEEDQEEKTQKEQKAKSKQELPVKGRIYGEMVRQVFKPQLDQTKAEFISENKKKIRNTRVLTESDTEKSLRESHARYSEIKTFERNYYSPGRINESLNLKKKKVAQSHEFKRKDSSSTVNKGYDYLAERRKAREAYKYTEKEFKPIKVNWKNALDYENKSFDLQKLYKSSEKLEKQAKSYETISSDLAHNHKNNLKAIEAAGNMYVESIQAKLEMLKSIV